MKSIAFSCVCCLCFFLAEAQEFGQCKETLKRSFAKMNAIYTDSSDLYLHYKITNKNASDKSIVSDDIEMYITKTSFIMKSSVSSYYADQKNAFMVVSRRRKIYQVDIQPANKARPDRLVQFVQSMLDSSTITSCQPLATNLLKVSVVFSGSKITKGQVKSVDYIIDTSTDQMKECMLYFNDSYSLVYTSYKFVEVKQSTVPASFASPVKAIFLNENNTLKPAYTGYTYQDLRQKKN